MQFPWGEDTPSRWNKEAAVPFLSFFLFCVCIHSCSRVRETCCVWYAQMCEHMYTESWHQYHQVSCSVVLHLYKLRQEASFGHREHRFGCLLQCTGLLRDGLLQATWFFMGSEGLNSGPCASSTKPIPQDFCCPISTVGLHNALMHFQRYCCLGVKLTKTLAK